MPNSLSQELIIEIIEDYKNNKSIQQISKERNIHRQTISKYLKENNIEIRMDKYSNDFKNKIVQDYLNNKLVTQIASDENISINTIYEWIKNAEIKLKPTTSVFPSKGNRFIK